MKTILLILTLIITNEVYSQTFKVSDLKIYGLSDEETQKKKKDGLGAKIELIFYEKSVKVIIYEQNGEIFISDIEKELNEKIAYCNIKLENEKNALKEINSVLLKEKQFFDYIDSMNLSVKQDDVIIPVNRTTLLNSTANYEYLHIYFYFYHLDLKRPHHLFLHFAHK